MPLNGSVKPKVKYHQLLLSKFPEAVKATPGFSGVCCSCVCLPPCLWHVTLERNCCILPGASGGARYRWFIHPNLSRTVAGVCLPSTQHEWGAISSHDRINNHLWLLSARISLRWQLPVQQHLGSCWGLTCWHPGGDMCVTLRPRQGHLMILFDAIVLISYSVSSPTPTRCPVMYAVVILLETLELNARCCLYRAFMKAVWLASVMSYADM